MAINGQIPTSQLIALPTSWSSAGRAEFIRADAYASFTRVINAAVAATGADWAINDAYRPLSEQDFWFRDYYEPARAGRSYVRTKRYLGIVWGRKPGKPEAAVPTTSNHGLGISFDLAGPAVQQWLHANASRFGWFFTVAGEPWHMDYDPSRDQFRDHGVLDFAWLQAVVGVAVDGKLGPATVAAIRAWQTAHGLAPDGVVGRATKTAMQKQTPTNQTPEQGDFLMALDATQQKALFDRVFGILIQRFRAPGTTVPVPAGTKDAVPCRVLDDLDGEYIVNKLDALAAKVDAIAARVK